MDDWSGWEREESAAGIVRNGEAVAGRSLHALREGHEGHKGSSSGLIRD